MRIPRVYVDNDEGCEHGKFAEFDDEAYCVFVLDVRGSLRVQSIHSSPECRGREILEWLTAAFNYPIRADEVSLTAVGFWDRMVSDGLVVDWSYHRYRGKTALMPELNFETLEGQTVDANAICTQVPMSC